MDPQISAPEVQIEKPTVPSSAPKRTMFMLIAMIAALLATTSYLAFKNYQLRKIIGKPSTSPFPTSSPTIEWKTYTNIKYKYSFSYPSKVNLEETEKGVELSWKDHAGYVKVVDNPNDLSPEKYAETKLCEPARSEYRQFCLEKVKNSLGPWGGSEPDGISVAYNFYENEVQTYIFKYNKIFVIFGFSGETGTPVEALDTETIQGIILTFKFLPNQFDAQRKVEIEQIRSGLEIFKADSGKYPSSLNQLIPKYLVTLPVDPVTKKAYLYKPSNDYMNYTIEAVLEDESIYSQKAP